MTNKVRNDDEPEGIKTKKVHFIFNEPFLIYCGGEFKKGMR